MDTFELRPSDGWEDMVMNGDQSPNRNEFEGHRPRMDDNSRRFVNRVHASRWPPSDHVSCAIDHRFEPHESPKLTSKGSHLSTGKKSSCFTADRKT
ncbi:unnamed protein product [Soboliphyme baturini]|uniref:Uncharacterized protein n=1 Tax=Soboliphyme baturini TaxID=241478 RepID=A0A183IV60_9BILA|nr:unnamed protein product [Soboliphyme baturini]